MNPKQSSRRKFITKSALAAFAATIGTKIVYGEQMPAGLEPLGLEAESGGSNVPGKSKLLTVLNSQPWNAETPAHLLDPDQTPNELFFVRNNGIPPLDFDLSKWTLTIDGESVAASKTYTLQELYKRFEHVSKHLVMECGGNGRAEFNPPASGNQWGVGAVGCAKWTGIRLKDVLEDVGIKDDAVYIGYYGADTHINKNPDDIPISRGVPMKKALEEESLIAWAMNDKQLPEMNGYPLRLVFGGWPASTSGKWLTRISVRNKVHDGAKMDGQSYRMPKYPIQPGTEIPDDDFEIIEAMPVKSLITYPKSGAVVPAGKIFEVRGHAWSGDKVVTAVQVSLDFGMHWRKCVLSPPINRLAWQRWTSQVKLPGKGYYEIWARATDESGNVQPMIVPGWNPHGYLNNACHRIAVKQV